MSLNPPDLSTPPETTTHETVVTDTPLQVWFDGSVMRQDVAHIPLTTHALHYGSGVFEGIRCYPTADGGAAVFRLAEHLERMRLGARALGADFNLARVHDACLQVVRANRHRDSYIRPLMWFGTGALALDLAPLTQHLMVASLPWTPHLGEHRQRLTVSPWRRNRAAALPPLKLCGNYVNSLLAKREAGTRGFDEALFVDDDGFVVECSAENVLMVKDGRVTAVEHADALPGITRATLIELTAAESRPVPLDELLDADEVFVCGTSAEVASVASIDDRAFNATPFTRELQALYTRIVHGQEPRYLSWLTHV